MKWHGLTVAAVFLLAACQAGTGRPGRAPPPAPAGFSAAWQKIATAEDIEQIQGAGAAWARGLAAARAAAHSRRIAASYEDDAARLRKASPTACS